MSEPLTRPILLEVARREGSRVSRANLRDVGERFTARVRMTSLGVTIWLYGGDRYLQADIELTTPIAAVLTRGEPKSFVLATERIATIGGVGIFAFDEVLAVEEAIIDARVRDAIASLRLQTGDELVLSRNRATLSFSAVSADDVITRAKRVLELTSVLNDRYGQWPTAGRDERPRLISLPGVDVDAAAGVAHWAIPDDGEREEAIEGASTAELERLTTFALDYGRSIEAQLESLDRENPNAASDWGAVLEASAEARLELARRGH